MAALLTASICTLVIFAALDAGWIMVMTSRLYRPRIGALLRDQFQAGPALAFYVIHVGATIALAVAPGLAADDPGRALMNGAVLGLAAYGAYGFSNWATLKGWPGAVTSVDTAWGTASTAFASWGAVALTLAMVAPR